MRHFMMDLETMGTVPGCAIVSIGVIAFDPLAPTVDELFSDLGFYTIVRRDSCMDAFLHESRDTAIWWGKQSGAAREALDAYNQNRGQSLANALRTMIDYVGDHTLPKEAQVFGNGSDFDNGIVAVAARMTDVKLPWAFGGRCYRTLKSLDSIFGPEFGAPPLNRSGTYHNALDDAKTQAMHLWEIVQNVRKAVASI